MPFSFWRVVTGPKIESDSPALLGRICLLVAGSVPLHFMDHIFPACPFVVIGLIFDLLTAGVVPLQSPPLSDPRFLS